MGNCLVHLTRGKSSSHGCCNCHAKPGLMSIHRFLQSVAGHISDPAIHTDPTSIQAQTWPSNHVTPQPVGGGGESQLPGSWSSILSKRAHVVPSTSDTLYYCKCTCFDNFTIVPLYMPENPSKPCTSCTKQFCLDQKLPICRGAEVPDLNKDTGTGKEGDVEARCFRMVLLFPFPTRYSYVADTTIIY